MLDNFTYINLHKNRLIYWNICFNG